MRLVLAPDTTYQLTLALIRPGSAIVPESLKTPESWRAPVARMYYKGSYVQVLRDDRSKLR